jgi:hypothetical protein
MVLDFSFNLDSCAGCIFTFNQIWKIEKSRFIGSQYCPIKIQKNIITRLNKIKYLRN